jgi:hypothetical protein
MTDEVDNLDSANDGFERYYTEKIWEWLPAIYKDEDGLAVHPDVLRSLVQILARQLAIARRSIDRLWDDQFIELCDDWAIPYIGDLVATRLVHEANRRGRRTDVAHTVFYRRRKGTPHVLETLIQDIAGWEGTVVESFRRLARTRHGLDPEPAEIQGFVTATPPGGWARLTSTRGAELVDGPFDEFFHTPDFRRLRGKLGRYNIPKLNFHILRLLPFEVRFVTPAELGQGRFTFDPSGRDIPLFRPDQRTSPQECHPPQEWEMPAPIPCRLLGEARYMITAELVDDLVDLGLTGAATDELSRYVGVLFRDEARLRKTMASLDASTEILSRFDKLLAGALTGDSPKAHLIPSAIQPDPSAVAITTGPSSHAPPIEHQAIAAGNLAKWGANLGTLGPEKTLVIDPERGRFWYTNKQTKNPWVPVYHYGFSGEIGAGTYGRHKLALRGDHFRSISGSENNPGPVNLAALASDGVVQFEDSKTYLTSSNVNGIKRLTVQAANSQRPYVKRLASNTGLWVFRTAAKVVTSPDKPESQENLRCLTLDGLWIGIESQAAVSAPEPCQPMAAALVLDGLYDEVIIRHCTLDPGGEQARVDPSQCRPIPYVRLLVRGTVKKLLVESSIVGPILEDRGPAKRGGIQKLILRDSIVHSIDPVNSPAIETELGEVELQRVTVFGNVIVNRLYASEALIQGSVQVTDTQHGCFRFSAADDDAEKRLPQQFESHLIAPAIPNHFFVSRRFGDAGYAQLSDTAPNTVIRGAENGSEIGAFSYLLGPIKLEDLRAKVNEFMPFGLIAQYINET